MGRNSCINGTSSNFLHLLTSHSAIKIKTHREMSRNGCRDTPKWIHLYLQQKQQLPDAASQPCLQKLTALEVWYEMNTNTVAKKNKHKRQIFKKAFGKTAQTRSSLTGKADVKLYRNWERLEEVLWPRSLSLDIIIMAPVILFTTELMQRKDYTPQCSIFVELIFIFYQLYVLTW